MLSSNFAEGVTENNPLQTPRPTGRTITGFDGQNEGGSYHDEYIDSDEADDDVYGVDDNDEVASQADSSETDFAHNLPHGDESFHFSESTVQQDTRQADDLVNSSQSEFTSAPLILAPPIAPDRQTPPKAHSTVLIRGVAFNTYHALLYYVGDNLWSIIAFAQNFLVIYWQYRFCATLVLFCLVLSYHDFPFASIITPFWRHPSACILVEESDLHRFRDVKERMGQRLDEA